MKLIKINFNGGSGHDDMTHSHHVQNVGINENFSYWRKVSSNIFKVLTRAGPFPAFKNGIKVNGEIAIFADNINGRTYHLSLQLEPKLSATKLPLYSLKTCHDYEIRVRAAQSTSEIYGEFSEVLYVSFGAAGLMPCEEGKPEKRHPQ